MAFTILVMLFWYDPTMDDGKAFKISHLNGKPLTFQTEDACFKHVDANYNDIKEFVEAYYDKKATVSKIMCPGS
tara:strand:+ start:3082 stop:3303 length:222 start_codon:yes stop_codon:yes gene_type:complete